MTPIVTQPIPTPTYLGDALKMECDEWLQLNNIHLRERWRYLLDSCVTLDFDVPDEFDYAGFCLTQHDTECARRRYEDGGSE